MGRAPLRQLKHSKAGRPPQLLNKSALPSARDHINYAWPLFLGALVSGLYVKASWFAACLASIIFAALALLVLKDVSMRAVDWLLLLVLAYEVPSVLFSQYRANSIRVTQSILIAALVFFCVRLTIRKPFQVVFVSTILGIGTACLGASGIRQFILNSKILHTAGFADLLPFRARLITPPWLLGSWLTLLVLGLPFSFALPIWLWGHKQKWPATVAVLSPTCIVCALCFSLSRAVFWSTVVFCLAWCSLMVWTRIAPVRNGVILLICMLGVIALTLTTDSFFVPNIFSVYAGQSTSQIRSTEGRIAIWQRSFRVMRIDPFWGVGSSNAAMAMLSSEQPAETEGFASRTFSLPVQMLLEKGIVGFLLYGLFLVLIAREFILKTGGLSPGVAEARSIGVKVSQPAFTVVTPADKSALGAMTCCFAAGVLAVLIRELVYASLFEHTLTLVLMLFLCALLVRNEEDLTR